MVRLIARSLGAALFAGTLSSCIAFVFSHARIDAPPDEARVAALAPGETDLAGALALLGAPSDVWALPGGACALAYGWLDQRGQGVSFQVPVSRDFSPSFDLESGRRNVHGVVLFFDARDVLAEVRRGHLLALRDASRPSAEIGERGQDAPEPPR